MIFSFDNSHFERKLENFVTSYITFDILPIIDELEIAIIHML